MKTKLISLLLILFSIVSSAQNQAKQKETVEAKQISTDKIYQLFPTKNYWTFIKLDTRNGKLWQVHFTVKDDGGRDELSLNSISLVGKGKETAGRFTLYPTENMYNFLLLDQIDGEVYQVQWSMEEKNRGIVQIKKKIDSFNDSISE